MTLLEICQEAVFKGFISHELAQQLNQILWQQPLNLFSAKSNPAKFSLRPTPSVIPETSANR